MTAARRKKVSTTVYLGAYQLERLRRVAATTKVPAAELIRQGIDLVLAQYRDNTLPEMLTDDQKQIKLDFGEP
jgi:hypothetical protein